MSDTSPFLLATADDTLPNSRNVLTAGGLNYEDTGALGTFTLTTVGNLAALNAFSALSVGGLLTYDSTIPGFVTKPLVAGTGITITNAAAQGGNPTIAVTPDSTVQQVIIAAGPAGSATTPTAQSTGTVNFVQSGGTTISAVYNSTYNRNDVFISSIASSDIPPVNATYILQTANGSLPDAQSLGLLTTGIVKVTSNGTTGTLSTASPTADYLPYSAELASIATITPTLGTLIAGNSTGFSALLPSAQVGDILLSGGTAELPTWLPGGTDNYVLTSHGPGIAPAWEAPGIASGAIVLSSGTTTQTFAPNNAYIPTATTTVTFSLPATLVPGDSYEIIGYGSGGWTVSISGGRAITVGNQASATISISSTLNTDSIIIYCVDATHLVANIYSGQVSVT